MPLTYALLALLIVALVAWMVNTRFAIGPNAKALVNLVVALIVIGVALWAVNTYIPMAESIKAILNVVVVIGTIVWVLRVAGLWDPIVRMWSTFTNRLTH